MSFFSTYLFFFFLFCCRFSPDSLDSSWTDGCVQSSTVTWTSVGHRSITSCWHPPRSPPLHQPSFFSPSASPAISLPHWTSHSRIIQHNENPAATRNSSLCAPQGMTTTAWDGDGVTGGREMKKRGQICLQHIRWGEQVIWFYHKRLVPLSLTHGSYSRSF